MIDWREIHDRLETAARALSESFSPAPENVRQKLNERARELARSPQTTVPEELLEALAFEAHGQTYAVEAQHVIAASSLRQLTQLAGAPLGVIGVVSVHGKVLPVLDLRSYFRLPSKGLTELNQMVVLGEGKPELALVADSILGLVQIPATELESASGAPLVRGVTSEKLAVLDGRRLLDSIRPEVSKPCAGF